MKQLVTSTKLHAVLLHEAAALQLSLYACCGASLLHCQSFCQHELHCAVCARRSLGVHAVAQKLVAACCAEGSYGLQKQAEVDDEKQKMVQTPEHLHTKAAVKQA